VTKTDACAVNTLLTYLLGRADSHWGEPPDAEEALAAAELLAQRAYRALDAGWRPKQIGPAWERAKPPGFETPQATREDTP
jgi:hypothetical protein